MEFDSFETDDMLTCILFNNQKLKQLTLYAIKWIFDTSAVDINTIKKMDQDKLDVFKENSLGRKDMSVRDIAQKDSIKDDL